MAEIADATSESFNIPNPIFAHYYNLYLTPLSKIDNSYTQSNTLVFLSTTARAFSGLPGPGFDDALSGQGSIMYLTSLSQYITLFDPLKFTTARQLKYLEYIYNFAVSPNDHYLISMGLLPKTINLEDLFDATKSKIIDISVSVPQIVNKISISNVGTGIMMTYNKGVLYDYINERKLAEINLSGATSYSNKISASGNFFYLDTYSNFVIYQYKDNQAVLLESGINQGDDFVLDCYFLPGNNEKMARVYHNRIEVLDCNTWTIEKKWLFPNRISSTYNLDIKSGKLLICENSKMILFDVMNGTREEIATIDNTTYKMKSIFYNNGYLFWGQEIALKIN
jgi:WD40 repeat protein